MLTKKKTGLEHALIDACELMHVGGAEGGGDSLVYLKHARDLARGPVHVEKEQTELGAARGQAIAETFALVSTCLSQPGPSPLVIWSAFAAPNCGTRL